MKTQTVKVYLVVVLFSSSCATLNQEKSEKAGIANEMENSLRSELLSKWYPMAVDEEDGGFLSSFSFDFEPVGAQDKMIVTQARHVWTNAKAAERYPDIEHYRSGARHGFNFLKEKMWDKENGGFYTLVDKRGNPKGLEKNAYGNAFGIYGLAAYYKSSGDEQAFELAKEAFQWLEEHSYDPEHKGYFQHLEVDGTPVVRADSVPSKSDVGYKDQNSTIHLLEAFTELYQVWPDNLLRERLKELLYLVRDTITNPEGYMTLFFYPDWSPVSYREASREVIMQHHFIDHVSFGHDVETAFLMLEAEHVLGIHDDPVTLAMAKTMVDHALQYGWDNEVGGFYDEGYYFEGDSTLTIIADTKNWWAQAEGLNSLLLMAQHFPDDEMQYFEKFEMLWSYVNTYLIDHENGGWYEGGIDKQPEKKTGRKGHIWKAAYHNYRGLANSVDRLRGETD